MSDQSLGALPPGSLGIRGLRSSRPKVARVSDPCVHALAVGNQFQLIWAGLLPFGATEAALSSFHAQPQE